MCVCVCVCVCLFVCVYRMPEFRFRRKKKKQQSSRRHTVHDAEETHATVAAAREMITREEVRGREGGREGGEGEGGRRWERGNQDTLF